MDREEEMIDKNKCEVGRSTLSIDRDHPTVKTTLKELMEHRMMQMTDAERADYQRFIKSKFQTLEPDVSELALRALLACQRLLCDYDFKATHSTTCELVDEAISALRLK